MDREVSDDERMSPESIDRMYRSSHMLKDDENGIPCLVFNRYEFAKQIQKTLSETCIKQKYYSNKTLLRCPRCWESEMVSNRPWIGLTDEDKKEYVSKDFGGNRLDAMDWAEQRLKEKNTNA